MSFASRLRQAREQAGFTQQDLAKKLGVTKNAISNYENGVSSPKWEILVEILIFFTLTPISCIRMIFRPSLPKLTSSLPAVHSFSSLRPAQR